MRLEKPQPLVKSVTGDFESLTDLFYCPDPEKMFGQYTEDKKQRVLFIWNDRVGKDGMNSPAGVDDAHNPYTVFDGLTIHEVDQVAKII